MKLFVWVGADVLRDHTSGQITALAPDLEGALDVIDATDSDCMWRFPNHLPTDVIDLGDTAYTTPRAWITHGGG